MALLDGFSDMELLEVKGRRKRARKEGMVPALKAMAMTSREIISVMRVVGESFSLAGGEMEFACRVGRNELYLCRLFVTDRATVFGEARRFGDRIASSTR